MGWSEPLGAGCDWVTGGRKELAPLRFEGVSACWCARRGGREVRAADCLGVAGRPAWKVTRCPRPGGRDRRCRVCSVDTCSDLTTISLGVTVAGVVIWAHLGRAWDSRLKRAFLCLSECCLSQCRPVVLLIVRDAPWAHGPARLAPRGIRDATGSCYTVWDFADTRAKRLMQR